MSAADPHAHPSQAESILTYLRAGHTITPGDALREFGCMRLGARILELRRAGHEIFRRIIAVNTVAGATARVAEYSLTPFPS